MCNDVKKLLDPFVACVKPAVAAAEHHFRSWISWRILRPWPGWVKVEFILVLLLSQLSFQSCSLTHCIHLRIFKIK